MLYLIIELYKKLTIFDILNKEVIKLAANAKYIY